MRIAVVGGGIAGLAAAWELRHDAEITVFEPGPLGGKIRTTEFEGVPIDEGPDAFLTRVPDGLELCGEVGISDELVHPAASKAMILLDGRLREIPDGLLLGVPRRIRAIAGGGVLSARGTARAALDLVLPRLASPATMTVHELVSARFGREVADRLVDPLIGGIHAGTATKLGAAEVAPQLVTAAERSRSLLLGLRSSGGDVSGPMFSAPAGGMGRLVDTLVESLERAGVTFAASSVLGVARGSRGTVTVEPDPGTFDGAVVATPAAEAWALTGQQPGTEALADVAWSSVVIVTVAVGADALPKGVSGFLVPERNGHVITACSFGSTKWPHWSPPGASVVRLSAGRLGDDRAIEMDDGSLAARLLDELQAALGHPVDSTAVRVSRWRNSFPQYFPGHFQRMTLAELALRDAIPGVVLAGSSYEGSGIPACISSGRRAARRLRESLTVRTGSR